MPASRSAAPRSRPVPPAVWTVVAGVLAAAVALSPAGALSQAGTDKQAAMPQVEREIIATVMDARQRYAAAATADARRDIRLAMQIRIQTLMAGHQDVSGWTGIVQASRTNHDGDRRIAIEIASGVIVATYRDRLEDPGRLTLIGPASRLYPVVDSPKIGDPVVFDAFMFGARIGPDDEMVMRPEMISKFSDLRPASRLSYSSETAERFQ